MGQRGALADRRGSGSGVLKAQASRRVASCRVEHPRLGIPGCVEGQNIERCSDLSPMCVSFSAGMFSL